MTRLIVAGVLLLGQAAAASQLYYIVFLRPSPSRTRLEKGDAERIQAAHMANIHKMADDGVLIAAGPFEDQPVTISGIFIFKAASLERAQQIAAQDPTVLEHRNTVDVHPWRGPDDIGAEYFRLHKADPKTPENMQQHPLCILYRGPSWGNGETGERMVAAHRELLEGLRKSGKLSAGGDTEGDSEVSGLVVFRPIAGAEAEQLMQDDPAVKAGVLRVEFHSWWCSDHVLPW